MSEIIISDIIIAFKQYTPYAIITGIFVMFAISVLLSLFKKDAISKTVHCNRRKFILLYILYVYCFIVISITYLSREPGSREGVDLKIFNTFSQHFEDNKFPVENIILFIPFGFMLPLLWNRFYAALWCMGAGFMFSLAIELSQYLTKRGYFQVDDIITNLIGTMIGFAVILGIRIIKKRYLEYNRK